jgi:hypothetical protein
VVNDSLPGWASCPCEVPLAMRERDAPRQAGAGRPRYVFRSRPCAPPPRRPTVTFMSRNPHPLPSCLPVSLDIDFAATYHHGVG